jgi:hypothetical protein
MSSSRALQIVQDFFPQVTRVRDARKDLHVNVTEKDVEEGRKKGHVDCVMAVACKRDKRVTGVIMAVKTAYIVQGSEATRYKTPERITREIVSFDRGGNFIPGPYELKAPSKHQKLGTSARPSGKKPHKSKIGKRYHTSNIRSVLGSKLV